MLLALIIVEESALTGAPRIVDVATLTIVIGVFAHGLTAPWLTNRYVCWLEAYRSELTFETDDVELGACAREPRPKWLRSSRTG